MNIGILGAGQMTQALPRPLESGREGSQFVQDCPLMDRVHSWRAEKRGPDTNLAGTQESSQMAPLIVCSCVGACRWALLRVR